MGQIELSYVTIKYEKPIVFFYFKQDLELGFPELKELISCAEMLSGQKTYVTLSDVRVNISMTPEGKRYLATPKNLPLFRGTAALVKNGMMSFAANFLSHFDKKPYPFKAFPSEKKAVEWLKTLDLEAKMEN